MVRNGCNGGASPFPATGSPTALPATDLTPFSVGRPMADGHPLGLPSAG